MSSQLDFTPITLEGLCPDLQLDGKLDVKAPVILPITGVNPATISLIDGRVVQLALYSTHPHLMFDQSNTLFPRHSSFLALEKGDVFPKLNRFQDPKFFVKNPLLMNRAMYLFDQDTVVGLVMGYTPAIESCYDLSESLGLLHNPFINFQESIDYFDQSRAFFARFEGNRPTF